ncbi:MAG TPA: carbohydrate ABC transporter permease [Devosia sp.]|nr:carbohydrate ABC transporter permease [Devosia sp.]
MTPAPFETDGRLLRLAGLAFLCIVLAVLLFPFVELISTALKTRQDLALFPPVWFPPNPAWANFIDVWSIVPMLTYVQNSVIVSVGSTALNAVVAIPAAFALARFRFPGRQAFLYFVIATQMFSPVVLLLATFRMMFSFGLLNTYWSLIFINATVTLPFTVWMLTSYFSTVPREIEEAALIDNTGRWRMLWDHFIPICMPGIVTALTFSFVIAWNEFLFAVTFVTSPEMRPLTTGIYTFIGRTETQWNFLMAASAISIVPVFIGFLLVQRRLISGLAAGAVK